MNTLLKIYQLNLIYHYHVYVRLEDRVTTEYKEIKP